MADETTKKKSETKPLPTVEVAHSGFDATYKPFEDLFAMVEMLLPPPGTGMTDPGYKDAATSKLVEAAGLLKRVFQRRTNRKDKDPSHANNVVKAVKDLIEALRKVRAANGGVVSSRNAMVGELGLASLSSQLGNVPPEKLAELQAEITRLVQNAQGEKAA